MVDQHAAGTRHPAAAAQDALLATKLHVPMLRADRVRRPELIELLDRHGQRGLLLVCAPAGYGKTMLLAEWVRRGGRKVAWLSLDGSDNDPTRFWRHLFASFDQVVPGTAELLDGPPASTPRSFEGPATALINGLALEPGDAEVLLVLDDYHLIEAPQIHELVDFLLEHRPPNLQLALASRSDPPLALARLRARDELTEIRVQQLRFTPDEAALLLGRAGLGHDGELPEAALAALTSRTEGWVAGLQLAALSLRGHPDVTGFLASFTGSHRHVLDYLTEEVLERQGEDVRTFLTETAVLERLSGPLCDALTGRTDSQQMLEQIERAGLFLIPLDEVRGWWRYHHLFADLLRARLQCDRGRAAALHRAAAAWYSEQGLADEAIHHTLAGGDSRSAAELIEAHFDTVFNLRGEEATIRRWLAGLPDDEVRSRPRLLLAQAQMAAMRGEVETMEPLIDAAERAAAAHAADEPFEPTAGRAASLLVNVAAMTALERSYLAQLRGDPDRTASYTARAEALIGEGETMLTSAVQGFVGMHFWLRGQLDDAEQIFASKVAGWRAAGQPTMIAWGYFSLAQIQRAQGRLDVSEESCRDALACLAVPGQRPLPAAGPALVGLAEVAYARNDLDAALRYLDEGIPLCRQFVHAPPLAAGLVTLAWIRHAMKDPDGARDAIGEARRSARGPAGIYNPVPAQAARLWLAQSDAAAAAQWVQRSGLTVEGRLAYPDEPGHLTLARVLIAQARPREALAVLDRLHAAAVAQQRTGSMIEISALRALAAAANGDQEAALAALVAALELAAATGHVRVFTDEGEPMSTLLGRLGAARRTGLVAAAIPTGYLRRVQQSFTPLDTDATLPVPDLSPLVDPLTVRESEILDLIAHGKSNQAIATQLVVSIDTVKKHVTHILDKLGATNRTEAVARSRELGLTV